MTVAPESLPPPSSSSCPALGRGAHLAPEDGACLMEAVSVAAQLPWSDSPSCTHPLVAHLARLVNDAMSPDGRQELVGLIPQLAAGTPRQVPAPVMTARVAALCTDRALRSRSTMFLVHLHRVAIAAVHRELRLSSHGRAPHRMGAIRTLVIRAQRALFGRGPAVRAVEAAVRACLDLEETARDRALLELLRASLPVAASVRVPAR